MFVGLPFPSWISTASVPRLVVVEANVSDVKPSLVTPSLLAVPAMPVAVTSTWWLPIVAVSVLVPTKVFSCHDVPPGRVAVPVPESALKLDGLTEPSPISLNVTLMVLLGAALFVMALPYWSAKPKTIFEAT